MANFIISTGPSDGLQLPVPLSGPADGSYVDVVVSGGGTVMTIQSIGGVPFGDAATLDYADIYNQLVIDIDANYGGILTALSGGTTKGDILAYDGALWQIKPIGADGRVLTANSGEDTGLEWA